MTERKLAYKGLMVQGTASDVGKSLICTAFCRLLVNEGVKVAPFKSQNMSIADQVLTDGKIIAKSQAIQAEAAKISPIVEMNPILLKPTDKGRSHIFCLGESMETMAGKSIRNAFYERGIALIKHSLRKLAEHYDMLILEGAGSPVEVNLKERELVNMKIAQLADVPVILVADIERGGVFASIIGTLFLLTAEERRRVQGIIINKFRGDLSSFTPGIDWIEKETGIPVLGVLPYDRNQEFLTKNHPNRRNDKKATRIYADEVYEQLAKYVRSHIDWEKTKTIIFDWCR